MSETDPEKNREIVEAFLGKERAAKYASVIQGGAGNEKTGAQNKSTAELMDEARNIRKQMDKLGNEKALQKLEPWLENEFHDEYQRQINLLEMRGFLETQGGRRGIADEQGNFYPVPSVGGVIERIKEKAAIIQEKRAQGFERFLLVPFACSPNKFVDAYNEYVEEHPDDLFQRNGKPVSLGRGTGDPAMMQSTIFGSPVRESHYFPTNYDFAEEGELPTKEEVLAKKQGSSNSLSFPGFQMLFLENDLEMDEKYMPDIPDGGRSRIKKGKSPEEYMQLLAGSRQYAHERGLTIEEYLTLALNELVYGRKILDGDAGGHACLLLGSFFSSLDCVPIISSDRDGVVFIGSRVSTTLMSEDDGIRTVVQL